MSQHDENPYVAPSSAALETAPVEVLVDAGKWRRFGNWLVDYVAIMAMVFVLTLVAVLIGGDGAIAWMDGLDSLQENLIGIALMLVYYVLMEGLFGANVGKWVTRTRVVDERGLPPSWRTAFLRSLARFIPFEPLSLLFAGADDPRGWHDRMPGTRVVLRRPASRSAGVVA